MSKYLRILIVILILGTFSMVFALPVKATGEPGSTPTITNIKANTGLIQTGDVLIYGELDIPYAIPPDEPANQAYNIRLIDTDGVTLLGSLTPYVLFDNGYNEGAFGFYFSADDGFTVNETYIIRITQSPSHFVSPQSWSYEMTMAGWTTKGTQEENQTELAINIIAIAQHLEAAHEDYTMLDASAGGTVLSAPTGETYFRGAIYGIQIMAPSLFLVQVLSYDQEDRLWTTDKFDEYQDRFSGEWIGESTANVSAEFGFTGTALMGIIYLLPISVVSVIISTIKFRKAEPGFLVAALVMIPCVLLGWFSTPLFALIYQLLAIYIGYLWFYSRS